MRQISPLSEATMALDGATATTLVNLASSKLSRRQFLPGNVLCVPWERKDTSLCRALESLGVELESSMRQTLTCLVPTLDGISSKDLCRTRSVTHVMRLDPIQAIRLMLLVHLLLACSVA